MDSMRVVDTISTLEMRIYEANSVWLGVPLLLLMENAGKEVARVVVTKLGGDVSGREIVVFVGKGGNGGDGLVAARHLAAVGAKVHVLLLYDKQLISSQDTLFNLEVIEKMNSSIEIEKIKDPKKFRPFSADILIDAMLGTGVRGELREPIRSAVKTFNESQGLKVAIDVPTGIDPDTGRVSNIAVKADITVTMHKLKPGLLKAREYSGEIVVAKIGVPVEAELYVGPGDVKYRVPKKPVDAHKGVGGRVLVIGGSKLYSGAPALSALAALRSGADLAFILAPSSVARTIAAFSPNLIVHSVDGDVFNLENISNLRETLLAVRPHSIVLGPGIGLHEETRDFVVEALRIITSSDKTVIVDADALKHIANVDIELNGKIVLTPHLGEALMLLGKKKNTSNNRLGERISICKTIARKYNAVVLLKGPIDIICNREKYRLNKTGNPGMSVGGTGDVLTGIIAALVARGVDPYYASQIAAYINGRAGDLAFKNFGERITALDIIDYIPKVFLEADEYPYRRLVLYDKHDS